MKKLRRAIDVTTKSRFIDRSSPAFEKYLASLAKYAPLSREEEMELFRRYKEEKDEEAFDKVIAHNLLFVVSVANKYSGINNIPFEDLVSVGNMALVKAARKFDYKKGNKFISYAVMAIKRAIERYINSSNFLYIRESHYKTLKMAKDFIEDYKMKNCGLEPSIEEVYNYVKSKRANTPSLKFFKEMIGHAYSFDNVDRLGEYYEEFFVPDDLQKVNRAPVYFYCNSVFDIDNKLLQERLYQIITSKYSKKVAEIFMQYNGICGRDKKSCVEIAKEYKIDKNYVLRIDKKIRYFLHKIDDLKEFIKPI